MPKPPKKHARKFHTDIGRQSAQSAAILLLAGINTLERAYRSACNAKASDTTLNRVNNAASQAQKARLALLAQAKRK